MTTILVLPGDGIGPEITQATLTVLRAADSVTSLGLDLQIAEIGFASFKNQGTTLPDDVLRRAREADGVILGPVSHYEYPPIEHGGINPSARLRIFLDLYANIRPSRSRPGLPTPTGRPMDLVIVRENTEGFYSDRNMFAGSGEFMPDNDMALSLRKITARGSERIARVGYELASRRGGKLTAVHKANVLKLTDGLFLREVRRMHSQYPQVRLEDVLVDAAAALLIRDPQRFDVIVTTNMFGDILSDEAAELAGSLGLGGSINAGSAHCVAQAQHGSAPDIAGQNLANPASLIVSAAMLLEWMGSRNSNAAFVEVSRHIQNAVDRVLAIPALRTHDLGGETGTKEFGEAVAALVRQGPDGRMSP